MKQIGLLLFQLLTIGSIHAQDIEFDQGNWQTTRLDQQQRLITVLANAERVDSIYTENIATGDMELVVQRYPLARYEYFTGIEPFPPLRRMIAIKQQEVVDTTYIESIITGDMEMVTQKLVKDIPYGEYTEYHRNGNIHVHGTLAGYDNYGKLVKKGEWAEWDENGKLIHAITYP